MTRTTQRGNQSRLAPLPRGKHTGEGVADHAQCSCMASITPGTPEFATSVYGTIFGQRSSVLDRLRVGDQLILVPDPPGTDEPNVWVHAPGGDVVGHLAPDINRWLVPSMLDGCRCNGVVAHLGSDDVASYKRLVINVRCRGSRRPS